MNELEVVSHACHHAKQPEWPRLKVGPIPISNCHCTAKRENARISGFHIAAAEMFALNPQSEILVSSLGDESEAGIFRERLSNNSLASLQSAIAPMAKTKEITMTSNAFKPQPCRTMGRNDFVGGNFKSQLLRVSNSGQLLRNSLPQSSKSTAASDPLPWIQSAISCASAVPTELSVKRAQTLASSLYLRT